jgi:putative OPT family oligopeptide transporter
MEEREKTSKKYEPYVSSEVSMKEFTLRAVLLGVIMSVILGAANAYLGLRAGMTIAATYPAAVISMAFLRLLKGNILEENISRTVGSIGESVAAGAIFTIPAFLLAGVWKDFSPSKHYIEATAIMFIGGVLGILFVTLLRRVMVEDKELPFPESVAASEIHKAGREAGTGAKFLFGAMGFGAVIQALARLNVFSQSWERFMFFTTKNIDLKTSTGELITSVKGSGGTLIPAPSASPAYIGVGYIIGPRLAALNFSGGLLSWGLFVPLFMYILGSDFANLVSDVGGWTGLANAIWRFMVRPIAIGGMLVSACFTLYRMRKNLAIGFERAIKDLKKAAGEKVEPKRVEHDLNIKLVLIGIVLSAIVTFIIYYHFSNDLVMALIAAIVLLIAGFFFAAVSGYLVGLIGSSNNPISGLTIATLIVAALLIVLLGGRGEGGVAAVLGVAAVVCVAAAVAGEMLQDLKVGHILGGTPWKMQVGDLIGVLVASLVMFFPLLILHQGDINMGGTGFGGRALPAPQAGLMALLAQGIVKGQMAWPLVVTGMLMAVILILLQVKSPMLVFVGMYLPFETSAAIFVGGLIKGISDKITARKKFNEAQNFQTENTGILISSGLIAGEALMGLVFAAFAFWAIKIPQVFKQPPSILTLVVFALLALVMIYYPIKNATKVIKK